MYASSVAALGAGFILDTRVCCYDPDLVASYHAAAPSALATAVQTAWPEARGSARGWGGSHALPTGSRVALQNAVSLPRAREWAQSSPCPLGSFRLVLGLLSARRGPQAQGPHHPYLKVCGCISLTDSARPRSFPSPWGLGRLLPGSRCGQGGQHERWGAFRLHPRRKPHSRGACCWLVWAASLCRALPSVA